MNSSKGDKSRGRVYQQLYIGWIAQSMYRGSMYSNARPFHVDRDFYIRVGLFCHGFILRFIDWGDQLTENQELVTGASSETGLGSSGETEFCSDEDSGESSLRE